MSILRKVCIFHANCADGFTAAWVVMRWANWTSEPIEYIPCSYGQEPPNVDGADVLMVDFSYKRPVLEEMAQRANSITVLDHHKTARDDLSEPIDGVEVVFDMDRSGAQITWDYFCDGARPGLVEYTADRDLWKWELDLSREISAALASYDFTFDNWDSLGARMQADRDLGRLAEEGEAILRKLNKDVEAIIGASKRMMVIGGHQVPVVNCPPYMASEVAGTLAEDAPFGASYYDGPDGRGFSLRSRGVSGEDVAEIAKSYGGGGHRNASGFLAARGWEGDISEVKQRSGSSEGS